MIGAVIRNLRGRALRTSLTATGIAIGILALIVVGGLAERLHTIVAGSNALNTGAIFAFAPVTDLVTGGGTLDRSAEMIRRFAGVRGVVPEVVLPYAAGGDGRFGPPALIFGFPPSARGYAARMPRIAHGRDLRPGDDRAAVVGADFAAAQGIGVGATIALSGNSFHVVGVIEDSFTVFDSAIVVPYGPAKALLLQNVPPFVAALPHRTGTALMVVVNPGTDTGILANKIALETGLNASDPKRTAAGLTRATSVFDGIIFGAALVALLIGAFSIVNTMTIAVTERTREIGIRKAIGAGDGDILREFLVEAAVIGGLGGFAGIVAGALVITFVNAHNAATGNLELFALTPRLVAGAFAFSLGLSAVAGLLPALSAARLDPVEALRRVA
ncbi:MAG: FtsX-like permease family protein [Candidatus Velthaea sp.]